MDHEEMALEGSNSSSNPSKANFDESEKLVSEKLSSIMDRSAHSQVYKNSIASDMVNKNIKESKRQMKSHGMCKEIVEEKQEDDPNEQLNNKMLKFRETMLQWQKSKIEKTKGEQRKEESLWVKLLLKNLQNLNTEIEQNGDSIKTMMEDEELARYSFEMEKRNSLKEEEKIKKEIRKL